MTTLDGFARSDTSYLAEWWRSVDRTILLCGGGLILLGLMLSLAAGPAAAERVGRADQFFFVYRHALFAAAGFAVLIATSMLDVVWARRLALAAFLGAFLLMAALLLIGHEAKGAQRWLRIGGVSFQPSEIVKPALIVTAAWLLAQRQKFPDGPWAPVAFAFYAATMGLLLLQPDVGQAALVTAGFIIVFFVSGLPLRWAAGFVVGGVGLAGALYSLLPHVRYRVNSFLNPTEYDTYQVDTARAALERGGLLGAGPGEGRIKSDLPDAHTDFIYSVAGEEFGLVACLGIIFVFAAVCLRGVMTAARASDGYARAAGVGLFALFGLQAAINIAVNVSLAPPKGMTLPFISYGGSSLVGSALTLGLALALTRRRPDLDDASLYRPY